MRRRGKKLTSWCHSHLVFLSELWYPSIEVWPVTSLQQTRRFTIMNTSWMMMMYTPLVLHGVKRQPGPQFKQLHLQNSFADTLYVWITARLPTAGSPLRVKRQTEWDVRPAPAPTWSPLPRAWKRRELWDGSSPFSHICCFFFVSETTLRRGGAQERDNLRIDVGRCKTLTKPCHLSRG